MKYYMHRESGDVATKREWREEFENMDIESWFGLPENECYGVDWIAGGHLIRVVMVDGEGWVEDKS